MKLSRDETLAFVTFACYLVREDGRITEEELLCMMDLAREVGLASFSEALDRLGTLPALEPHQLRELANYITSMPLRHEMYSRLVRLAYSDGLANVERHFLAQLAVWWRIDSKVERVQDLENVPHFIPREIPVA